MFKAYLDESGTHKDSKVVAVAGWATDHEKWDIFEVQWRDFLKKYNLKKWHHTHFYAKREEYSSWNEATVLSARYDLCKILNSLNLSGVGKAVIRTEYEEVRKNGKWNLPEDPYDFCLERCLNRLFHGLFKSYNDEGMAVFADYEKRYEATGSKLFEWHKDFLNLEPRLRHKGRPISLEFVKSSEALPIQAADILVHETYKYYSAGGEIPILGATLKDGIDPHKTPIIESLKEQCMIMVQCLTKPFLDFESTYQLGFLTPYPKEDAS